MGSKSPSTTTQVNTVQLSPEQQQLAQLALPFAQQYANQPLTPYGSSTVAGFTPLELQAQTGTVGVAQGQMQDLVNAGSGAQARILDPSTMDVANNPYVNAQADAITAKTTQNLLENILPQLRNNATGNALYAGGGSRAGLAEGQAVGRTNEALTGALAQLYGGAYNAGLGATNTAIAHNPAALAATLLPNTAIAGVGGQQRAMDQALMDEQYRNWALAQQMPYIRASELYGLVSGMPGASGVSSVTGAQPQTNPIMGGLGGASAGLAMASMIPGLNAFAIPMMLGMGAAGYLGSR